MRRIAFFTIFVLGLLSSFSAEAKNPPNGVQNYISGGHLFVWYQDHYVDMGVYNPG